MADVDDDEDEVERDQDQGGESDRDQGLPDRAPTLVPGLQKNGESTGSNATNSLRHHQKLKLLQTQQLQKVKRKRVIKNLRS